MTRIYTDKTDVGRHPESRVAIPNQIRWQASLPTRPFLKRPLASRVAPLLLYPQQVTFVTRHSAGWRLLSTLDSRPLTPRGTGLRLACQAGRCFRKASESSLASVLTKQLRHSCNESTLGFRDNKLVSIHLTCARPLALRLSGQPSVDLPCARQCHRLC